MSRLESTDLTFFESLLAIDCTTGREADIARQLSDVHRQRGYTVHVQPVLDDRVNLLARSPLIDDRRILFSTHIDTVPPHLEWRRSNGTYYGRGACDTKGGIVSQMRAGAILTEAGIPCDFLWVVGEETDHIGAHTAMKWNLVRETDVCGILLCEPTANRLAVGQKGIAKGQLTFRGKQAHSGFPHLGEDANRKLIDACHGLIEVAETMDDPEFGDLDVNIGLIDAGVAANVISDHAEASFLARTNQHHDAFVNRVNTLDADVEWVSQNAPFRYEAAYKLNYPDTFIANFNTDAVFLQVLAPVYLFGPGDIQNAHADHEHIHISDMEAGINAYIQLATRIYEHTSF